MEDIKSNLEKIDAQIRLQEKNSHRPQNSVSLLAVSKFHSQEEIISAIKAGQLSFGENRVQEILKKFPQIKKDYPEVSLHLIGHLQSNKVKNAVLYADYIESVDSLLLLKEIEKQCSKINKNINILLEVHTGEESKSGFQSFIDLEQAVKFCSDGNAPHLILSGFMTMAPFTTDEKLIRSSFRTLKEYSQILKEKYKNLSLDILSMGMSGDFKIAIDEGSTQVRIGTAIFGERIYN